MMSSDLPFACDLSKFTPSQKAREKVLLAWFKSATTEVKESEGGWRFVVPATEDALARAGELLALERLCCPFLTFHLEVTAADHAAVHIFGTEGAKPFIAAEFSA